MSAQREPWSDYRICRECAHTGATVKGNDGWYRHVGCARDVDDRPNRMRSSSLAGCRVVPYHGGNVRVVRGLVHSVTTRLGVRRLAERYGEQGRDYRRLVPTHGHPCEEVEQS